MRSSRCSPRTTSTPTARRPTRMTPRRSACRRARRSSARASVPSRSAPRSRRDATSSRRPRSTDTPPSGARLLRARRSACVRRDRPRRRGSAARRFDRGLPGRGKHARGSTGVRDDSRRSSVSRAATTKRGAGRVGIRRGRGRRTRCRRRRSRVRCGRRPASVRGNLDRAAELLELALSVAEALGSAPLLARGFVLRSQLAARRNRPEEGVAFLEQALAIALEHDQFEHVGQALLPPLRPRVPSRPLREGP